MELQYTNNASKSLTAAIPTTDANENVVKWDIEVTYACENFETTFEKMVTAEDFEIKPATDFTKTELMALCPLDLWDNVFNSYCDSLSNIEVAVRDQSFNVSSLPD